MALTPRHSSLPQHPEDLNYEASTGHLHSDTSEHLYQSKHPISDKSVFRYSGKCLRQDCHTAHKCLNTRKTSMGTYLMHLSSYILN